MNRRPILAALARLAALAVVVQVGTIWVCSSWFWSPIQRHYLPAYFWSSLPVVAPSTVEVRLIWKTRQHRKPELASDDDAVRSDDGTGMALSQSAIDAGWTGLTEGSPQQVSTAILGRDLADLAFDGESLWDFLLLPELCGDGGILPHAAWMVLPQMVVPGFGRRVCVATAAFLLAGGASMSLRGVCSAGAKGILWSHSVASKRRTTRRDQDGTHRSQIPIMPS